jgi:hypothetical protein
MTSTPDRQAALAAALRANLRRRKAAERSPADPAGAGEAPSPPASKDGGARPRSGD